MVLDKILPSIGGFGPLPVATMIPFMEAQSASLAYAFGINYEFGKRKIKSMSNEQFNALDIKQIEELTAQHTAVQMEGLQRKLPQSMGLQQHIIDVHKEIESKKMDTNKELFEILLNKIGQWAEEGSITVAVYKSILSMIEDFGSTNTEEGDTNVTVNNNMNISGASQGATQPITRPTTLAQLPTTRNKASTATLTKTPQQLSEQNIKRMYQEAKTLQIQYNQLRRTIPSNFDKKQKHKTKMYTIHQRMTRLLTVIKTAQESHKKNFGQYVTLT